MAKHNVTLQPSGEMFEVRHNEIILDAAIRQGVEIVFTCRNGTCRTCLSQVHEGTVEQLDQELCMISPQELVLNKRLLCLCTLTSDAIIEPKVRPKAKKPL